MYDGHGSVRALTDQNGNVTDTYDYDAFGNLTHQTGTTPNEFLFAGEQYDTNLHLYYNRARYLNTSTGRFWSIDTAEGRDEEPLSLHKYLYAEADPVDNADPSGNQIDDLMAGVAVSMTLDAMPSLNFGQVVRGGEATSRINGIVQFLVPDFGILSDRAYSDPSHWGSFSATGTPTIVDAAPDSSTMEVWVAGSNPLVPGAPDIDLHLKLTVEDDSGQVHYTGHLSGDAFPDVEVFVVNRENTATMLLTFATKAAERLGHSCICPAKTSGQWVISPYLLLNRGYDEQSFPFRIGCPHRTLGSRRGRLRRRGFVPGSRCADQDESCEAIVTHGIFGDGCIDVSWNDLA